MRLIGVGLCVFLMVNCQGKLETNESGAKSNESPATSPAESGSEAKPAINLEIVGEEVVAGVWFSSCIVDTTNDIRPGGILQYQFGPKGEAQFKLISYRDATCESRYTKADVDKLRARLQADAAASGLPPPGEAELKALDVLWIPPTTKLQYKLGRKFTNKLMEIDLSYQGASGPEPTTYTTFFIEDGLLYFAKTCAAVDSFAGRCSPVVGDQAERRAKKVDFSIGFEKRDIPLDPL